MNQSSKFKQPTAKNGVMNPQRNFLPASTNGDYHGSLISAWFLTLMSLATIIPGCIHTFLPDGGAGVIAGLDLSRNGPRIIGLFAWAGTTQIVWGLLMLVVSLRNRNFVPLLLGLLLIERSLHALNMWVLKYTGDGHHPPETYLTLAALPIIALFLGLSLRQRGR